MQLSAPQPALPKPAEVLVRELLLPRRGIAQRPSKTLFPPLITAVHNPGPGSRHDGLQLKRAEPSS